MEYLQGKHSINISKDEKSTNQNGKLNKKANECLKRSNRLRPSDANYTWREHIQGIRS